MEPIYWREKVMVLGIEPSYGVDAGPTAAQNAILATDVRHMPMEGADTSRNLDTPHMGAQPTLPTELHSKFTFNVELVGSGTLGVAPAWGPLARACGLAEVIVADTSVTYNPVSTAHESATIWLNIGGTVYRSRGVRGTAKVTVNAQGIPVIAFELTGLFVQPIAAPPQAPTLTAWKDPVVATSANTPVFTIAGTSLAMRSFELDLACQVERRFLIGSEGIRITDRSEVITTTVEAVPLATLNPFALAASAATVPVLLTHGTDSKTRVNIAIPKAQMQRVTSLDNAQGIKEWPLRLVPLPTSGNDQFTITLS